MRRILFAAAATLVVVSLPRGALAHGIGEVYALPIPLHYYLLGAAAAVAVSFFASAALLREPLGAPTDGRPVQIPGLHVSWLVLRALVAGLFVLLIVAGMFGEQRGQNIAPYLFWVFVIVGLTTLSLVIGNGWEHLSPWQALASAWAARAPMPRRLRAPGALGPTLLFGLFWWELVSGASVRPALIGQVTLLYSLITVACGRVFDNWFRDADPLSSLFGLIGRIAPLRLDRDTRSVVLVPWTAMPLEASWWTLGTAGVLLGGASFDSLKESLMWFDWLRALGLDQAGPRLVGTVGLLATVMFFVACYLVAVYAMALLVRQRDDWAALAHRFVPSLVPVAVGYTLAHNFPLTVVVAPRLLALASDPLGSGWNVFGTASVETDLLLGARLVWFVEIGLVILGHIGGIWLAHLIGLRVFNDATTASRSQYPMALLMIGYTALTLWLLSQPLVVAP